MQNRYKVRKKLADNYFDTTPQKHKLRAEADIPSNNLLIIAVVLQEQSFPFEFAYILPNQSEI